MIWGVGAIIYILIAIGVAVRIDVVQRSRALWFPIVWGLFWPLLFWINLGAVIVDLGEVRK